MAWALETSNGNEVRKVRDRIAEYLRGKILDIGCGGEKVCCEAIGLDYMSEAANIQMDITNPDSLGIFSDASFDVVFSSHFLEDVIDFKGMLAEMCRLVKVDGVLILYLPHKHLYPNIGEEGANPRHKHDFLPEDIVGAMPKGFFMERTAVRDKDDEYSFELIFRKTAGEVEQKQYDKSKTVVVVRYGGFGDMVIVAPIYRILKEQGYYVIANCSADSKFVLDGNPYIDEFIVQSRYAIPTTQLKEYFDSMRERYGKVINLCESMERTLLLEKDKDPELWSLSHGERHERFNRNYADYAMELAGLDERGCKPELYLTETEKVLTQAFKLKNQGTFNLLWQLSGSSWHKIYPHSSDVIEELLDEIPDLKVFMTGGDNITLLSFDHPRLANRVRVWGPRQAMVITSAVDCVISPETGVLNAAGAFDTPKIGLLTHSSKENLTKHFINDYSIQSDAPCSPCHKMIHEREDCPLDSQYGLPVCMSVYMDKEKIKERVRLIYQNWRTKMKEESGGSVKTGLSEQSKISPTPKSQGMDTTGSDQKPMANPSEKVSKNGMSFNIC